MNGVAFNSAIEVELIYFKTASLLYWKIPIFRFEACEFYCVRYTHAFGLIIFMKGGFYSTDGCYAYSVGFGQCFLSVHDIEILVF